MVELTGFGAACLAGLAVNFWKDQDDITSYWKIDKTFTPLMPKDQVAILKSKWKKAIACAQEWEDKPL
jgi:glycerol kinase